MIFHHPLTISFDMELWLVLPLLLAVGLVYKTLRVRRPADLPREMVFLAVYMAGGLVLLCLALWMAHEYWP